jgi:signal peptidase I
VSGAAAVGLPLVLVVATAASGAVWGFDALSGARRARRASGAAAPALVEYARAFFPILLLVLVLRSFVAEPFRIPSASMLPTLEPGDFILVNKYAYGLRLPVLDRKVVAVGQPARGDVVVFRFPPDPRQDYIKRVVGLPGDVIEYRGKALTVNGERVPLELLQAHGGPDELGARLGRERLAAADHQVLVKPWQPDPAGRWVVPDGHYFVLGDNRDNSRDSRVWGFVPESHLVGRATLVWMSWRPSTALPRWERVGLDIR